VYINDAKWAVVAHGRPAGHALGCWRRLGTPLWARLPGAKERSDALVSIGVGTQTDDKTPSCERAVRRKSQVLLRL